MRRYSESRRVRFRIDPGDDEAVLFTLAVIGVQSAPYKGLEDKDPLKGSGPGRRCRPAAGAPSTPAGNVTRRRWARRLIGTTALGGVETLADACWVAMGGKLGGLERGPRSLGARDAPHARYPEARRPPATEPLIDAADAVGVADAALSELLLRPEGAPLPDGVAAALFADDCVVLGEGFAAMPLRNAAKQQPWGGSFDGASFCNYRIAADDARRVLCDVVLPSGRLGRASVYVDEDEKAFRCSVGWVIREGEKANPLS